VTSVVREIDFNFVQWKEMADSMVLHVKLEITSIRTKHARRSYFFCVGKAKYKTPLVQEQAFALRNEDLPRKTANRRLMQKVKDAATKVINSRIACRVQPNPTTPLNEEQIDCVAETIQSAINFAAALDLDRCPRLSRTLAGKLTNYRV
jgi:hypothetical protein